MKQNFAAVILGGTGQVGGAAVAELLAIPECREVLLITRKPITARSRVRNVVLDTGAGAKKNCSDLNSASSVLLHVAAIKPESPSFACFLQQEALPAAGFAMPALWV